MLNNMNKILENARTMDDDFHLSRGKNHDTHQSQCWRINAAFTRLEVIGCMFAPVKLLQQLDQLCLNIRYILKWNKRS